MNAALNNRTAYTIQDLHIFIPGFLVANEVPKQNALNVAFNGPGQHPMDPLVMLRTLLPDSIKIGDAYQGRDKVGQSVIFVYCAEKPIAYG